MKNCVFLGDSLIYGYGVPPKANWVNKIKELSSYNILNGGVNGSTTTDMLVRFDKDVLKESPSKVFIMGGTNDLLSNRSVNSILCNLELMIKDLYASNIDVLIGIPPTIIPEMAYKLFMPTSTYTYCKKQLPILKDELISLCNKYNCSYIDFFTLSEANINCNIFLDGIHLTPAGHDLLYKNSISYFKD